MKNNNFSRFTKLAVATLVLLCGVAFTGCKPDVQYRDVYVTLEGTWVNAYTGGYESYTITNDTFKSGGDYGYGEYEGYAGNNLVVRTLDKTSGFIYIKYTRAMNPDYSYSEDAADVGNWYAIMYSELTSSSVKFSGAYKADETTSTATLEEAIAEFTVENGYFASGSTCAKQ